ncbi:MAG TPA: SDR family NAD(P)-dependent oxidoreductase [Thermoanaerobaculia bacterium]|nr:SDR family NAD(P)-dependent oxidoreductase [Thermoanaerobaculia bacterium]
MSLHPPDAPPQHEPRAAAAGPAPPQEGRVVLVTGATGALGASVVERFVAGGDRVLATGRDATALAVLAARHPGVSAAGGGAVAVHPADLADPAAAPALFAAAAGRFGAAPTVVAHLAGGFRYAPLAALRPEDWRFLWRANVESTVWLFAECARRFGPAAGGGPVAGGGPAAGGGTVVAVSAPAALAGAAGFGPYAAGKAGALRLVEALARELAPAGGRANAVLPGTMDTPANRTAMPDADPAGWVTTDAVADVVWYLASPAAAAVNGAAVGVPGPTL